MLNKISIRAVVFVLAVSLLAGCKSQNGPSDTPSEASEISTDPVTLQMLVAINGLSDNDFKTLVEEPLKKKYPFITLQMMRPSEGQTMADLVAAGTVPDLMYGSFAQFMGYHRDLQVAADLTPLITKFKMDMSRFDPNIMKQIETYGEGAVYSIPFSQNTFAMFYNKGIFDKFGISYPTDGMFWEDAIELAKKVTRADGGVQYRGLEVYNNVNIRSFATQLSLDVVDPNTDKAIISDKWKEVFQKTMDIYSIPGNRPAQIPPGLVNQFLKDRVLAMAPTFSAAMLAGLADAASTGLDWDIVQQPSYKEVPNTSFELDVHQLFISATSKHKDQAFEVINFLASDEIQLTATKAGKLTSLNDPEIRKQYAANLPYVQGKNIQGILKSNPARLPVDTEYNGIVNAAIDQAFRDVFKGNVDINTALRQAEEKANQNIQQQKQAE